MKKQRIRVNTKGGLLAAFECARCPIDSVVRSESPTEDFCIIDTEITLERRTGITIYDVKWSPELTSGMFIGDIRINSAKREIRKIPARGLLA